MLNKGFFIESRKLPTLNPLMKSSEKHKPKVLIVAASLDILGGQAVQAQRLIKRFKQDDEIEVGFLPINPRLPGVLGKLQKIKYVRTVITSLAYWFLLFKETRKYDIVQAFSASYLSYFIAPFPAILIAKLWRKKTILNYHSGEAENHLKRHGFFVFPTLRLVDKIVVPSDWLVEIFAKFELKAVSVFNHIELDQFVFRERLKLNPDFLANRNFEPHYNVGCVLKAFGIIQKNYPEASLTVAGGGSQREFLEQLAKDLKLNNIVFRGRIAPEEMPKLYDQADIYLNASSVDNQPLSLIEAFASGTPVVTTNAGGIPFMVEHEENGLMADCEDFQKLAEYAERLLEDNSLTQKIVENGRLEMRKYEWQSVKYKWLSIYHELLS